MAAIAPRRIAIVPSAMWIAFASVLTWAIRARD
jgi:tryptophan-rich sensory protein